MVLCIQSVYFIVNTIHITYIYCIGFSKGNLEQLINGHGHEEAPEADLTRQCNGITFLLYYLFKIYLCTYNIRILMYIYMYIYSYWLRLYQRCNVNFKTAIANVTLGIILFYLFFFSRRNVSLHVNKFLFHSPFVN